MPPRLSAGRAAITQLSATTAYAQPAPLMTVLITPGVMSEAVGKGDLDVTMTIPGVDVTAGAPFLSMGMFVPGLDYRISLKWDLSAMGAGVV